MADTHSTDDNKKGDFWDSTLGTITKITALITAITALIVAINQFNSVKSNDIPKPTNPSSTVVSVIRIGGSWRDNKNLGNGSNITQEGNSFQFEGWGTLPQGVQFKSTGSGTITGQSITTTYTSTYQNGWTSQGNCSGTISPDGSQMTLTCTDNVLGTFVSSAVRQ